MPRENADDREDDRERTDPNDAGAGDDAERQDTGGRDDDTEDTAEFAGDDTDDGEHVDDEGDDGDGVDDEPARRPSRREQRIQRLANERATDRAEKEQLRRELADLRGQVQSRSQTETAEQQAARFALLSPEERSEERLRLATEQNRRDNALLTMRLEDVTDKTSYEAKSAYDPVYRRHADEVETRLKDLRAQGQNVGREALLKFIIGEKALARAGKDGNRQQRRARELIERETVRPSNGRGAAPARRGKVADTPRERLKDVYI